MSAHETVRSEFLPPVPLMLIPDIATAINRRGMLKQLNIHARDGALFIGEGERARPVSTDQLVVMIDALHGGDEHEALCRVDQEIIEADAKSAALRRRREYIHEKIERSALLAIERVRAAVGVPDPEPTEESP